MNNISNLKIIEKICVGKDWKWYDDLKQKPIGFCFELTEKQKEFWTKNGFPKLRHLLSYLKKKYGDLEKFDIIFFKEDKSEPFYFEKDDGKTMVYVNIDTYLSYGNEINPVIERLKISSYSREIKKVFSNKVPPAFFDKIPAKDLIKELENSHYKIIENLIKEFENMPEREKEHLKNVFEHSFLGTEVIDKYIKAKEDAPEKQLKLFLKVIDKLGKYEVEELLHVILNSKISTFFIKKISELPLKEQNKIARKMDKMAGMYDRYIKLSKSLKEFEKKISEHIKSQSKNERDIHSFLFENYWLLGIEYFDKCILSDIDIDGKKTNQTSIGRLHPDIMIKRMDGFDKCVVIELEEANDKIFKKDGTLSPKVFDGINQALNYHIEQKANGENSKGIAVIGSILGMNLTDIQKKRLEILSESFNGVEVLTYEHIVKRAKTTIDFFKKYEKKKH
ncbi:MAG: Shedu anti-phage system protein SduA domain-containing protein [Candidatus Aenigmatarchaeota archaeon]